MGEDIYIKIATLWGPLSLFVGVSYLLWVELKREREKNRQESKEALEKLYESKLKDVEIKNALRNQLGSIHSILDKIAS